MPRSRYWPMTIGTPVKPRTASTIAMLMDAMSPVPFAGQALLRVAEPGDQPEPDDQRHRQPEHSDGRARLPQEQLGLDKGEPAEAVDVCFPLAFHAPAGQRHVGAVQAASLDPQVGYQHLPAGQFGGDGASEVAGAGDVDLIPAAAAEMTPAARSATARRALDIRLGHRPEPHPVLAPGAVHKPRRGVQRREPPRSRIATRLHSSSTSSMKWLTSTTVTPCARTWLIRSQVACRAPGSSPEVSSSRNTTSGFPIRASET